MRIPILSGVYVDADQNFRTALPVNLIPVAFNNGISEGYFRQPEGMIKQGEGYGVGRGGYNWKGVLYRVSGSKLIKIASNGEVTVIGDVGDNGETCVFAESFDVLGIASNGNLFYYDGINLVQVTDLDLGIVKDLVWIDGYFMTTDGDFLVVTELNNRLEINPLKYGSSEVDPDPINRILKYKDEIYALNSYTTEVFDNVGGDNFPFQVISGAQLERGCVGSRASAVFAEAIAFVGRGRNEQVGVYIGINSNAEAISTSEVDRILNELSDEELSSIVVDTKKDKFGYLLYIHLSDKTLVYNLTASQMLKSPAWCILTSSASGFSTYRARNFVNCYGRWNVDDPTSSNFGYLTNNSSGSWGEEDRWELNTTILYNDSKGAQVHRLELIALSGNVPLGYDPLISTSYSTDGVSWSQKRSIKSGKIGERNSRIVWWQNGFIKKWRIQKFEGTSKNHISIAALESEVEGLSI